MKRKLNKLRRWKHYVCSQPFLNKLLRFNNNMLQNNDVGGKLLLKSITEVVPMSVNYNNLWKLLIDKGITKTEMRSGKWLD